MRNYRTMSRLAALLLICVAGNAAAKEGGVFTAGDLWESYLPSNAARGYTEASDAAVDRFLLMRIGNWDRQWTTPTQTYPGGENIHLPWGQDLIMAEYSSQSINTITTSTAPRATQYANGVYTSALAGAGDPARDWTSDGAYWVNGDRTEMRYEGRMPTTLGIDVGWRLRQYTANAAHLNDFIVIELELTNTGIVDIDGDGSPEKTGNRIDALTLLMQNEPINSMVNNVQGRRGTSGWYTGPTSGYDATPDAVGSPWDVPLVFTGPSKSSLTAPHPVFGTPTGWLPDNSRLLGVTMRPWGYYYDIYNGMQWIAVKKGALPTTGSSVAQDDKMTIYDSHPVGEGAQRGWFTSVVKDDGGAAAPRENHIYAMSVFFDGQSIGSRTWDKGASIQSASNLVPDPNWFDPNDPDIVPGDPLSFVNALRPAADRRQPLGDMKYNQTFDQNWEVDPTLPLSQQPDWAWTRGYSIDHNFDGLLQVGTGPYALEVGETVNLVLVEYAGFRLQGIRAARKTAQWVYDNGFDVPTPPPTPSMAVAPNTNVKIDIKWDDRAEADPHFAGYKVYRSNLFPRVDSREIGIRIVDHYQEQTVEEPTDAQLAAFGQPNNPNISSSAYKMQEPAAWGPYRLIKRIPRSELSNYLNDGDDSGVYRYKVEDPSDLVTFGFTYYYYVSAYSDESGEVADVPYTSLESHRNNFNGRDGLWHDTFHYATASSFYPTTLEGQKDIGRPFVLKAPLADAAELVAGDLRIRVVPNPYKKGALHDTGTQHQMLFINLPTGTKITILDVSGQVIDMLRFEGTNPFDGTLFWDMFSKDGIEVASGLYIFVAEYPGGAQTGHFAILR